jgi:hypothetical protein
MIPHLDGNQIYGPTNLNRIGEAVNVFNDLFRNHQRPALPTGQQDHDVLWVKNSTGANRARFDAVSLGVSITTVAQGEDQFLQQRPIVMTATTPAGAAFRTPWAVLLEDIPADKYGPAVVAGLTIARVNVTNSAHRRVAMTRGSHILQSGFAGQARLVWFEAMASPYTTGEQWAIIEFGCSPCVKLHAKSPADGIPVGEWNEACTEFTPGSADCVVFRWDDENEKWVKLLDLSGDPVELEVFNGVDEEVGGNKLIAISSDDDGVFSPVVEGCNDGCAES